MCFFLEKKQKIVYMTSLKEINKDELFKNGKYFCPVCDAFYASFSKLSSHIFVKHIKRTGICEKCGEAHDGSYGIGRFCSKACANSREHSEETKEKISENTKPKTYNINTILKLKEKNPKYDYSNTYFFGVDMFINVFCFDHGFFSVRYSKHLEGQICPDCLKVNRAKKHILDFNIKHNYKYKYDFKEILNLKKLQIK